MKFERINLEEFRKFEQQSPTKVHNFIAEIQTSLVAEQDNTPLFSAESQLDEEVLELNHKTDEHPSLQMEELKKQAFEAGYDKAKKEAELDIIAQNQDIAKLLKQIRKKLNTLEEVQTSRFSEFIDGSVEFIENIIRKIIKEERFASIIASSIWNKIKDVADKVADKSAVVIHIPISLGEGLINKVKQYQSALGDKVRVAENESGEVKVEWESGYVILDPNETLDVIEEHTRGVDTRT